MAVGSTPRRTGAPVITSVPWQEPLVIKVTAPWCTSCRALGPIVDEVATRTGVQVIELKPDTDSEQVERLGVRSVPTLVAVRDGKEVSRLVGLQSTANVNALFAVAAGDSEGAIHRSPVGLVSARIAAGLAIVAGGAAFGSVVLGTIGVAVSGWGLIGAFRR